MAGHKPARADPVLLEQCYETWRADARAELAARNRRRRASAARDETGNTVEIESEADDVLGHGDE